MQPHSEREAALHRLRHCHILPEAPVWQHAGAGLSTFHRIQTVQREVRHVASGRKCLHIMQLPTESCSALFQSRYKSMCVHFAQAYGKQGATGKHKSSIESNSGCQLRTCRMTWLAGYFQLRTCIQKSILAATSGSCSTSKQKPRNKSLLLNQGSTSGSLKCTTATMNVTKEYAHETRIANANVTVGAATAPSDSSRKIDLQHINCLAQLMMGRLLGSMLNSNSATGLHR